jgi:hypothetical protein
MANHDRLTARLRSCLLLLAMPPSIALTVRSAAAQAAGAPQYVPDRVVAVEVRRLFMADLDTLQRKFIALAEAFPADKYAWRPAPGVRSVGEAFMHVASEFYLYTPLAYGTTPSPVVALNRASLQKFETMSSKAEVLTHLKAGFAYASQVVGTLDASALAGTHKFFGKDHTVLDTSFDMTDDLHEHMGQLIAYARMNGITPPWSK